MVELDGYVGQLLKKPDDLGIADNTIVVFTTDNGAEVMRNTRSSVGWSLCPLPQKGGLLRTTSVAPGSALTCSSCNKSSQRQEQPCLVEIGSETHRWLSGTRR
jgi:arylsulfatase A-like enzyme